MKESPTATERVGRYQLLEPIGGGPNGMVFRAKVFGVAGFERQFAVKRFAAELTAGALAQALSSAARSYGSLEHPRIARMSEFGVAQGQTFTAVEYVAGLDAFRLLQEAKLAGVALAAGGALALVSQAARAVGYAHGRGLSHLGLCPTNVIVTIDGDVKVTDFGILAATMPARPVESPRLAHRVPYLAPEQLAGEATSAATDVFVLGVIAYELVTGQRAYRGDTPAQISQAILSGPPAEPPLPRPIVRVLQRCLARSPFERFPDARALADALDAALRVAPVPGTRKDIGAQIKATLDKYAALNEGNLSGMVALNLQNAALAQAGQLDALDISTQPFMRPDAKTEPSPIVPSATATIPEHKPFTTVTGIAPPPIPVPPGVASPPTGAGSAAANPAKTVLGLAPIKKPVIPSIVPPIGRKPNGPPASTRATPPPLPVVTAPDDVIEEPSGLIEVEDSRVAQMPPVSASSAAPVAPLSTPDDSGKMPVEDPATMQGLGMPAMLPSAPAAPAVPIAPANAASSPGVLSPGAMSRIPKPTPGGHNFETRTGEMSPVMLDELNKRSVKNTAELESLDKTVADSLHASTVTESPPSRTTDSHSIVPGSIDLSPTPAPMPMPDRADAPRLAQPTPAPQRPAPVARPPAAKQSRAPAVVIALLALAGLGAGGWYAYTKMKKDEPATTVAAGEQAGAKVAKQPDRGSAEPRPSDKPLPDKGSAAQVATATVDAGTTKTALQDAAAVVATTKPDAAIADKPPAVTKPTAKSDKLKITSKPAGARVFIDGADQGTTPVTLDGSADRHTLVLLLPGHDLYIGEVDGSGVFDIGLKPVTPSGGHAGIKVLKCKQKERYYVYVDGKPTGMTCPTERIDTVIGDHTVEVYDIVTDSRRKWDIYVKDERLSFRVRIED